MENEIVMPEDQAVTETALAYQRIKEKNAKREDRDRSPTRQRVFPDVEEVKKNRCSELAAKRVRAGRERAARVNKQLTEVKKWILEEYATGGSRTFFLSDGHKYNIEDEVVAQLQEEGYVVENAKHKITFPLE